MYYGYKYRLEVTYWARSFDGDDWVDSNYWLNFNSIDEAFTKINTMVQDRLIEVRLYDMSDSKDLVYSKDYITGKVEDYTLFDHHNKEYDNG